MNPTEVIQRYFQAMQSGPKAAASLFALFADQAVYIEPFSGAERTHTGRAAIEACLRASWQNTPPDLTLEVNRVDIDGDTVRSEWTCRSPAFEAPVRGVDVCVVKAGLIERLEVRFA
ncbi:MAG: nuclear transport factor 2 family protein [Sandaracinaceae bacterium]